MNGARQNSFVWNDNQKPINWSFPTSQNNANMHFNSNSTLKPTMNPIQYDTNSTNPHDLPHDLSTLKRNPPNYAFNFNTMHTNKTNLDPVEDMDWSYYEPSYYKNKNISLTQFFKSFK